MVAAGTNHFLRPDIYEPMLPLLFSKKALFWVWVSGYLELLFGICLLTKSLRKLGGWGLFFLLIAIYPANINMAINNVPLDGQPVAPVLLWLRLPFQFLFLWLAWWTMQPENSTRMHPWDKSQLGVEKQPAALEEEAIVEASPQ